MTSFFQNPHLNGEPFFLRGGPVGVLLIHGYTATPAEVRLLGDYLAEKGFTVSGPRLPGHGSTPQEMNRCRWQEWAAHVEQAYEELRAICPTVFVGGESMGGLLALHLATSHPEIAGLMAYATALVVANKLIFLTPIFKYFIRTLPKGRADRAPAGIVDQRWQGYTVDPVAATAQLLALQRTVRRELRLIKQPILIVQGLLDKSVDPQAAALLYKEVSSSDKELVWMQHSTHCVLLDQEWEDVAARTLAFINRVIGAT